MTKKYGVGDDLNVEDLTDALITGNSDYREPFKTEINQALTAFIKNNQYMLLPEEILTEIIEGIAEQADLEQEILHYRKLLQEGKCRVPTEHGEEYYYFKETGE